MRWVSDLLELAAALLHILSVWLRWFDQNGQ
jgi:hypothetical protein